jgi:type VI secretion system protein ImpF
MATADVRDRLQPALLDRLADDARGDGADADDRRVMSKSQLRQAVLRDLRWLFNAVQPLGESDDPQGGSAADRAGRNDRGARPERRPVLSPDVLGSVVNFGLPALSGKMASRVDVSVLERAIRQAIVRFEPRILADTLEVRAMEATSVLDTHNVIAFEIRGHLWSQPVPLEILLRTQIDLEAGQVQVRDVGAGAFPPAAAR